MPPSTTADGPSVVQRTPDAPSRAAAPSGRQGASALARLMAAIPRAKHLGGVSAPAGRTSADADPGNARAVAAARRAR
jgi:hypothetical protein